MQRFHSGWSVKLVRTRSNLRPIPALIFYWSLAVPSTYFSAQGADFVSMIGGFRLHEVDYGVVYLVKFWPAKLLFDLLRNEICCSSINFQIMIEDPYWKQRNIRIYFKFVIEFFFETNIKVTILPVVSVFRFYWDTDENRKNICFIWYFFLNLAFWNWGFLFLWNS